DATETLLALLASAERIEERRAYFAALRQMTEGTDLLVNMLTHDEWYVVRNVADLCGEMRLETAVGRLARHASHPDERVRRSVALLALRRREGVVHAVLPDDWTRPNVAARPARRARQRPGYGGGPVAHLAGTMGAAFAGGRAGLPARLGYGSDVRAVPILAS